LCIDSWVLYQPYLVARQAVTFGGEFFHRLPCGLVID
jgi:hypothetical protein